MHSCIVSCYDKWVTPSLLSWIQVIPCNSYFIIAVDSTILKSSLLPFLRAGKNGRKEHIEHCTNQCQIPYQTAANVSQQEIANFQNRLQRAMMQCQDDVQGMITPDVQNDDKKMKRVEDNLLKCFDHAIQKSREGLRPMKQRIESQLKWICFDAKCLEKC